MADEDSTGVSLNAARIGAKIRGLSTDKKNLTSENAQLKAQLATLTTERDGLRQQVLTPDAAARRIADLTASIRTGKHRAEFDRQAKQAGFPDDLLDLLYTDSGHKAETDEPDAEAIKTAVEALKTKRASALGKPGETSAADGTPPPAKTIPGQGRGGQHNGIDGTIITAEHRADPKFMLNPANRAVIARAAEEHRFR